ncbi:MAG: hypothetical protein WCO25_05040 [Candidatus Uhrbacteria bacterium]
MSLLSQLKHKGDELTNEQKAAFVLLTFLGLGGVVLGFLSFGANIRRPFDMQLAKSANSAPYLTIDQKDAAEKEAQKTRDTDADGLTDYDELYVFRTSPYISDTDSDGIDDKTEAYAGTNPNCPEGKACGGVTTGDASGTSTAVTDLVGGITDSGIGSDLSKYDFKSEADVQKYVKSITVDQIRKALAESGVPQEKLDAITDEQLQTLFAQTVSASSKNGELDAITQKMQADAAAAAPADDTTATTTP